MVFSVAHLRLPFSGFLEIDGLTRTRRIGADPSRMASHVAGVQARKTACVKAPGEASSATVTRSNP